MTTTVDNERRLAALEAVVPVISRIEEKLDAVVFMAGTIRVLEERMVDHKRNIVENHDRLDTLETTVTSSLALAKGAVFAATAFWTLLQGGVAYLITDTLQTVREHDVAIAQMKQIHAKDGTWQTFTLPKE